MSVRKTFIWNYWNIDHIRNHRVSQSEARYVVEHAGPRYPKNIGDGKYLVHGRTEAGRALQVIFLKLGEEQVDVELLDLVERMMLEQGNEVLYVIHARELTGKRKRNL